MRTRVKVVAEAARAPQSREEAEAMLARLGEIQRDRALIEAALSEDVTARRAMAEAEGQPLAEEADRIVAGLRLWAEANRPTLTDGGRTKTVKLATGEIAWRIRPPSVRLRDMPMVIEALVNLGLARFLRTKTEVNKEAMLAEPVVAASVPGVSIGSEGEEIVITPLAVELVA
jgi:phage host-nuclease inhibitor protein Gam